MHKYWLPFVLPQETPGDGGGGGKADVQNLGVPGPDDDDIDVLAGDEDDDGGSDDTGDEGDELPEGEEEAPKPKKEKAKHEGEDFDVEIEDEEESDEEEQPRRKEGEEEEQPEEEGKQTGPYKALKEKYPNIFKEFPDLRRTIGEHQRFRSLFTSVDEAQEVAQHAERFIELSDTVMRGDFESLIDAMEQEESGSSANLVKKVLPTIKSKNKDLYFDITEPVLAEFLHAALSRANASGDQKLKNSTYWLNAFLTGRQEFPKAPGETTPDPREKEFENKIKTFEENKIREARGKVWGDVQAQLSHRIERALDPKGDKLKGKDVTKKALISQLLGEIDDIIAKDEIHMNKVNRLWHQARRSSFSQAHLSRIINAYLERANAVLPKLTKKVREENGLEEEAPRRGERRENENRQEQPHRSQNRPPARLTGGKPTGVKSLRDVDPRKIDYNRTTDDDVFAGKVKLKRR